MLGGQRVTAAAPWADAAAERARSHLFWHIMTNTPVHPKEPDVFELMGATPANEMLPSLLAKQLAPCLARSSRSRSARRGLAVRGAHL